MLDWFYDTPIVRELKKIRDKPVVTTDNKIKQSELKRDRARANRKKKK